MVFCDRMGHCFVAIRVSFAHATAGSPKLNDLLVSRFEQVEFIQELSYLQSMKLTIFFRNFLFPFGFFTGTNSPQFIYFRQM